MAAHLQSDSLLDPSPWRERFLCARRALALITIPVAFLFAEPSSAQAPVLQRGYDPGVTGANLSETVLNTSNVNATNFGMLFKLPVDDVVFAQPLYVPSVTIPNQGVHNVLYVATMSDTLYAFDADVAAAPLWKINFASLFNTTAVPIANFAFAGNRNITGNLGILSTPVIDRSTNTIYVVACTLEANTMVYRLHAVDITSGATRPGSGVKITGSYGGSTFDGRYQTQRLSLVLAANQVVFGFGALEEEYSGGYVGWMMAYDKTSLTQTGIFATVTTGTRGGGVWQSGRPSVVDGSNYVYAFVGNAFGSTYDGVNNFNESVLKLDPKSGLSLIDWFTPSNWSAMDSQDLDLSSSGPMLIPGTGFLTGGGKTGDLYVLDTSNLGKYDPADSQIVQKENISASEIRGGPVYWPRSAANGGPLLYNWGVNDRLKAYAFNGRTFAASPSAQGTATNQIYPGGILTLSANGDTPGSGVIWATTAGAGDAENNPPVPGVMHAYDAGNVANELWNTSMNAARDGFGNLAKFVPPVVANGKVYLATWSSQVAVYGIQSVAPSIKNAAPGAGSSGTTVTLQGTGFAPGASVTFGGVAATNVTVSSSTKLTAVAPAHAAGQVDVVLTNPNGRSATLTNGFNYKKVH